MQFEMNFWSNINFLFFARGNCNDTRGICGARGFERNLYLLVDHRRRITIVIISGFIACNMAIWAMVKNLAVFVYVLMFLGINARRVRSVILVLKSEDLRAV
jgi:hypothetical protein